MFKGLKPFEEWDADRVVELLNDPVMAERLPIPYPYTKKHALEWIRRTKQQRKHYQAYAIMSYNDFIVGQISLTRDENDPSQAYIGYWIGKDYQGKGYATEALKDLLRIAWYAGYKAVYGGCGDSNLASAKVMQHVGMKPTGEKYAIPFKGGERTLYKYIIYRPNRKVL